MKVKGAILFLSLIATAAFSIYFLNQRPAPIQSSMATTESDCNNHIVRLSWNNEGGPAESLLKLHQTCSVGNMNEFKNIVEQSMNSIRKSSPMNVLVICEGQNGVNQYIKLKTSLVGFQKICREDGACRSRFKMVEPGRDLASNLPWVSLEEVFTEKICPAIGSKLQ